MSPFPHTIQTLLDSGRPLVGDGAMGTMLHARGVGFDQCFDELNLTQPALVADIHREYIDAGAQIIQTNTFGSNAYKLAQHGLEKQVSEINSAAVELARRVVMASFKQVFIAGDVGPLGVRLALLDGCSLSRRGLPSRNRLALWLALDPTSSSLKP